MPYPEEILPGPSKKIIDCDINGHFLIRHVNTGNVEDILDTNTGLIKIEHICTPSERIDDLSTSLLGIFQPAFLTLEFTQEGKGIYMHYCAPNEAVETPLHPEHYGHNHNRHFWCFLIAHVNNIAFNYTRGEDTFVAICRVCHTPMRWNFWHFSLRWDLEGIGPLGELPDKERKKIARKIGHSALVTISKFAKVSLPEFEALNSQCYDRN